MARDSQAALVALNRFGFGARGGASGDFVNAASDPRGFVKAELSRPNGVLLEIPGLAVDAGAGEGGVPVSVRDPAGARRRSQIDHRRCDRKSAAGRAGRQAAATAQSFAQQHRQGHLAERTGDAAGAEQCRRRCRRPRPCSRTRQSRRRSRRTSSRKPIAPRRWRGCSAPSWPIAVSPSGWWCSGPIISASPPARAGWRGCGPARSSARRSGLMCSGVSPTC